MSAALRGDMVIDQELPVSAKLRDVCKKIHTYDLNSTFERLVLTEGWKPREATAAIAQYRNYLYLCKLYPTKKLPPSKDIDEVWHAHILQTKQYRKFCKLIFPELEDSYLDHDPHLATAESLSTLKAAFEETQFLYKKEFGNYIYKVHGKGFFERMLDKLRNFIANKFSAFADDTY